MPIIKSLRWFVACFFSVLIYIFFNSDILYVQIGGATAQIGDPSGKSKDRDKQSSQALSYNINGITQSLQSVFDNHAKYFWKQKDPLPEPM